MTALEHFSLGNYILDSLFLFCIVAFVRKTQADAESVGALERAKREIKQ